MNHKQDNGILLLARIGLPIKIFTLLLVNFLFLSPITLYCQGVAINTTGTEADPSSMLDVSSTDKGVLISRMSTAQRDAIASPAQGLLIYNTTTQCFEFYENSNWNTMGCTCTVPDIPVSTAGSGATATQITANWNAATGATSYSLDVSTVSDFSSFEAGYNDLDVGTVTTYDVTGLTCNTTYYYRIRAVNACGTTGSSNTITYTTAACFSICGASTYNDVTNSTTGKVWLDRNLGASQVATSSTDYLAYGSLFQWGRLSDGHECITWTSSTTGNPDNGTTATLSSSDNPGHSLFITTLDIWRSPGNDNLWQGVAGINNPCPSGYRLPTSAELNAERVSWSTNDISGAYASTLKFVLPGWRNKNTGALTYSGSGGYGYYWSSTIGATSLLATVLSIFSGAGMTDTYRGHGMSVRCIKN